MYRAIGNMLIRVTTPRKIHRGAAFSPIEFMQQKCATQGTMIVVMQLIPLYYFLQCKLSYSLSFDKLWRRCKYSLYVRVVVLLTNVRRLFYCSLNNTTEKVGYCHLLIRVTTVEVCDATDDASSTGDGYKKIIQIKIIS